MVAEALGKPVPLSAAVIGVLAFVLIGGVQALYGPSLPGFSGRFGVPVSTAGLVISAHGLGALVGVLSAVPLAGHPLARYRVGAAVALLAVGALGVGLAPAWPVVLLGALMVGVGYGALTIGLNSLFAAGFGPKGAAMVNLLNALFGVGAVLSPLLVGRAGAHVGWPFLAVALGAGVLTPFALTLDDRVPSPPPVRAGPTDRGHRLLVGFLVLLALGVGIEASSSGWTATYLVSLGHPPVVAANLASLFYLVFTASRLAAVPLSLRLSTAALLLLAHVPLLAPSALVTLGGAVAMLFPNMFTWLARALPGANSGAALVIAGALLGGALFPALVGRAVAAFGAHVLPTALLVLTGLALVLALGVGRRLR